MHITKAEKIRSVVKNMPYFTIENLAFVEKNRSYLRVLFCRLAKRGKLISLKRGVYVSAKFVGDIERKNAVTDYAEFIGNVIYTPSYLSLEYVLEKYGVLSEAVKTITLVSTKKTNTISNQLAGFQYHQIKKSLFSGFEISKKNDFLIAQASLAKALFDFLYFRKNILFSKEQIEELRLNLDVLQKSDWREFKKYIQLEGSKKMQEIFEYLITLT